MKSIILSIASLLLVGCASNNFPKNEPPPWVTNSQSSSSTAPTPTTVSPSRATPAPALPSAQPRHVAWSLHAILNAGDGPLDHLTVPDGKILVIEFVSARFLPGNTQVLAAANYQLSVNDSNYYFSTGTQVGPFMEFTGMTRIYATPGSKVRSVFQYPVGKMEVSLSGYWVDADAF